MNLSRWIPQSNATTVTPLRWFFGDVIKHSIDEHESQMLHVKIESATEKFIRNFTIKPRDMHERGKMIIPNDYSWTVKVSRSLQTPSPLVKGRKSGMYKHRRWIETENFGFKK